MKNRRFKLSICVNILVLLMIVVLPGCTKEPATNEVAPPQAPTVLVGPVLEETIPIYADYLGRTESSLKVDISSRVEGFLDQMHFSEGGFVEKGQLLYTIDDASYRTSVVRNKAEVERSRVLKNKSDRDLARIGPLFEQDAASQKDYDQAVTAAEEAKANLSVSLAILKESELQLSYTKIYAPLSGLIGETGHDLGELVSANSTLNWVLQIDPIRVRFSMTDKEFYKFRTRAIVKGDSHQLKSGQQNVIITLPDGSDYQWKGEVKFTDPQVNPKTGSFAVRAVLPNPDAMLQPGQYTDVQLRLGIIENGLLIPQTALQVDLNNFFVYVIGTDNVVSQRFIEINQVWEDKVVIATGLKKGETVIIEGMLKVKPGVVANPITSRDDVKLEGKRRD